MRVLLFAIVFVNVAEVDLFASDMISTVVESKETDAETLDATKGNVSPRVRRLNIDSGFVFLNGCYVDTPYQITFSGAEVSINENPVTLSEFDVWKRDGAPKNGEPRSHSQQVRRQLRLLLEDGGSLVMFDGQPLQAFRGNDSYDLLKVLANSDARKAFAEGEHDWLPQSVNAALWNKWIDEFKCSDELAARANETLARIDYVLDEHQTRVTARKTLETFAYPLTVAGMLLVVLASGHLLAHRPGLHADEASSHLARTNVTRSVLLIASLSLLDLVWTILVSRTGDMKELNPLGAALITSPTALIAMKSIATALAVVILFSLRHHRIAQLGAWWASLICTLLTIRWLTFQSMFV